jgi:TRAP transporter 4TM/12TM fusion protein
MIVEILFGTGKSRTLPGVLGVIVKAYAALLALWVVYSVVIIVTDIFGMMMVFLSAILVLVFLTLAPSSKSTGDYPSWFDWVLAAASAASGVYFWMNLQVITNRITLFDPLSPAEFSFGILIVVLTLEATRRSVGLGLTLIVLVFIVYNLFGHLLSGELAHGYIPLEHFIDTTVYTTDSIYGVPLRVAATYAFLFVLFGTTLARAGGSDFFYRIGALVTGRTVGGTAKIAVFSSGAYGMISGSPVSDVVTTGAVTIPTMERAGYHRDTAGGIECAASTGGSIMPPVMGSVAFIMAEYTGIPYYSIALSAIIPALLYYLGVFVQVHYLSKRLGMRGLSASEIPSFKEAMRGAELFLVPLGALIGGLAMGYSATFVAVFGTVAVFGVALFRKESRIGPVDLYNILAESTMKIIGVTAACAAAGLVIGGLSMTGLAAKFSSLILTVSGDWLFLSLLLAALITILLGMGMPTPSVYILATVLVGPVLQKLGLSVLTANMFLLYYSVLSASTPPVAVAAYAAAAIANGNPMRIGAIATKLSVAAAIVPFSFAYSPELLLVGDPLDIVLGVVTAVIGVFFVGVGAEGYFNAPLPAWSRLLVLAAGLCFVAPSMLLALVGTVLLAVGLLPAWRVRQAAGAKLEGKAPGAL